MCYKYYVLQKQILLYGITMRRSPSPLQPTFEEANPVKNSGGRSAFDLPLSVVAFVRLSYSDFLSVIQARSTRLL